MCLLRAYYEAFHTFQALCDTKTYLSTKEKAIIPIFVVKDSSKLFIRVSRSMITNRTMLQAFFFTRNTLGWISNGDQFSGVL